MPSVKATIARHQLFVDTDVSDVQTSFVCLVLDLLSSHGTDGSDANVYGDVLAQITAAASHNSAAAVGYLRQVLNSHIDRPGA